MVKRHVSQKRVVGLVHDRVLFVVVGFAVFLQDKDLGEIGHVGGAGGGVCRAGTVKEDGGLVGGLHHLEEGC